MKTRLKTGALGLLAVAVNLAITSQAHAHGYTEFPKARQAICEEQKGYWWPQDGSKIPNAACRAAFLESGHTQFTQLNEISANVPDYTNQQAIERVVPDGTLCAAGDSRKKGLNVAHPDWQRTEVTLDKDNKLLVRFFADTPHNPSFWHFYLTNPGFDSATQKIKWSDLQHLQTTPNVDFVRDPDGRRFYDITVQFPAGRDGDATFFVHWQREDVVGEGFYNCSDITIKDSGPVTWTDLGFFVRQGTSPKVGETALARVFNPDGKEIVIEQLLITDANLNAWQQALASQINDKHSVVAQVGLKQADGSIVYDAQAPQSNKVYSTNVDNTFQLSILPAKGNTAPQIVQPSNQQIEENTSQLVHVHAFDDENDPLTYSWTVPSELAYTASGANITFTPGEVQQDTDHRVTVTVSDGKLSSEKSFTVSVMNKVVVDQPPVVQALANVSVVEGKQASLSVSATDPEGATLTYNWNVPAALTLVGTSDSNAITVQAGAVDADTSYQVSVDVSDGANIVSRSATVTVTNESNGGGETTWSSSQIYVRGNEVIYDGIRYRAKWWNRNQNPKQNSSRWAVWEEVK